MITLRHDNLGPVAVVGRAEELIALLLAHANAINAMRCGSVEIYFNLGQGAVLWLHDRLTDYGPPKRD